MSHSPLLPLHERAGARMVGTTGSTLVTYGDVPAEYRAALGDALLFDNTDRGAVLLKGPDARELLHRVTSCDIQALKVGSGCPGLLLDGKGKVQQVFDLSRLEEDCFRLSTPPDQAAALLAGLDMYVFAEDVELTDVTDRHAPIELLGPHAGSILGSVLGEVPEALLYQLERVDSDWGEVMVTHLPVAGGAGWRLEAGPDQVSGLWEALLSGGAVAGGLAARDCLRVEAGAAAWGVDVDPSVYPQEARLESAFSLTKGCYIGQEVVAKIDTYGGLNKRLMALRVHHADPVSAGTRLWRELDGEWRDLGVVTSWAYSFVLDTGLVLAYVKRKHQEPQTTFRLGEGPAEATLVELPVRDGTLT